MSALGAAAHRPRRGHSVWRLRRGRRRRELSRRRKDDHHLQLRVRAGVLEVKVGDTITVDNKDSAEHTVTARDKSFDTGRFASGTKTFTVAKAGRFEYVCDVHPFMTNRVIQVVG